MLGGFAITFILINVEREKIVKFKGGERTLEDLLNNINKDWKSHILKEDISIERTNEQIKIIDVIEPINNYFIDDRNRSCLSLQIGYKYEWFFYKELKLPVNSFQLILKGFINKIMVIQETTQFFLYHTKFDIIYGICYNHSYFISKEELEKVLHKPKDSYIWYIIPDFMELKDTDMYRIYPKNYITLPSKQYIIENDFKSFVDSL